MWVCLVDLIISILWLLQSLILFVSDEFSFLSFQIGQVFSLDIHRFIVLGVSAEVSQLLGEHFVGKKGNGSAFVLHKREKEERIRKHFMWMYTKKKVKF